MPTCPRPRRKRYTNRLTKDLTEAEECLPLRWDSDYTGRLTWGAARSLHARTYMMRNDWDNMYTASTEVIKSGIYNLNTPVDKVFTVEGKLRREHLRTAMRSHRRHERGCQHRQPVLPGARVRGAGEWDLGWGWHMATKLMGRSL